MNRSFGLYDLVLLALWFNCYSFKAPSGDEDNTERSNKHFNNEIIFLCLFRRSLRPLTFESATFVQWRFLLAYFAFWCWSWSDWGHFGKEKRRSNSTHSLFWFLVFCGYLQKNSATEQTACEEAKIFPGNTLKNYENYVTRTTCDQTRRATRNFVLF